MKNRQNIFLYIYIFIFLLSAFAIFSNGRYGGDGLENYLTAESIVLDGDTIIYDRPFDVHEMRYEERAPAQNQSGYRSSSSIGIVIFLVPFYFLGHIFSICLPSIPHDYITQFFVSFVNPLIITLTALILFGLLQNMGFSIKTAYLTLLCFSFSTMSIIYTRSGFSDPLIGLLVLLTFLFIYRHEKTRQVSHIIIITMLVGFALLVKKNAFLYLPIFFIYLIHQNLQLKSSISRLWMWSCAVIIFLICIIAYLYNKNIISSAGHNLADAGTDLLGGAIAERFQFLKGASYYLFSTGKGFFFYNFVLPLGFWGTKRLYSKDKRFASYLIIFIVYHFLFYAYRFNRGSLFSWGPRYLYPAIPLFCILLAGFIEETRSLQKRLALILFSVVSFLIQLPCLFISFSKYLFFVKEKLNLEEYLINFVPELSPIVGSWLLLLSAIKRTISGISLNFIYNPDPIFIKPVSESLAGYDSWDIWWVNAVKISPKLLPLVYIAVPVLAIIAFSALIKIRSIVANKSHFS